MPDQVTQPDVHDDLKIFERESHVNATNLNKVEIRNLQSQLDKMSQQTQAVISGVLVAAVLIFITVAVEIILFHSNGVSEEEYINALNQHKEYNQLYIDAKLSEFEIKFATTSVRDASKLNSKI